MIRPEVLRLLDDVSLAAPWSLVERFSTLRREHPDEVRTAANEIVARLESFGVPVTVHEPSLFLSLPGRGSVRLVDTEYRAKPMAMSRPAPPPKGLTAQLAYVPSRVDPNAAGMFTRPMPGEHDAGVLGKLVVTEGLAMPGKAAYFEELGAVGLIAVNPGRNPHWGICTTIWGTPDLRDLPRKPQSVVVAVNHPDGQALIAAARRGESATVMAQVDEGWYVSPIPVVTIRGTEEPEPFVLLHGHYDSWDVGVGDNAVGNATMLEIARVLWTNRDALRRSVRIAWWPGHSTGRYAGSTWFADHYALDLYQHCIAQVNCDSPGCRWATEYIGISWMPEAEDWAKEIIRTVSGKEAHGERPHQAGDYSFNNIGLSGYFMLLSTMPPELRAEKGYYTVGGCGGNIAWHTEEDTLEIADRDILLTDIKIYLAAVAGAANATIAPFDFGKTAADIERTLDRYQAAAGSAFAFDGARAELARFTSTVSRFARLTAHLEGWPAGDPTVRRANAALRRAARHLVPVNFTSGPEFFHDPAETIPPLPDLAPALVIPETSPDGLGFLLTHLTRGQNRLVAALQEARRALEDAAA